MLVRTIIRNYLNMLKLQKNVPIKETFNYLSKFPRFSLLEKISPHFFPTSAEASLNVAGIIKEEIIKKNALGQTFVLGLATGSTPLGVYRQLIRMHKSGELSFKNVVTFNLDEYFPITKKDPESYNYFMNFHLFNHIDIPKENINIPNGEIDRSQVTNFCLQYQKKIASYGGIDIQILGIGRTGHIGFNEPPSPIKCITRLVYLHRLTRNDAANNFGGYDKVPKCAISMGIDTIKKAKKILIMAWGQGKAPICKETIEGEANNPQNPSTFLHDHPDITFFLDKAAGQKLTRYNTPWVIKGDIEDPVVPKTKYWVLKSVTWLSEQVKKPILRLTYDDYEDHNLAQLVMECADGSVEDLNLFVYKKIFSRITGWPLGKQPEQSPVEQSNTIIKTAAKKERVLIFSPHPDDDVISMGGTLKKLYEQGHDVHVAYMTSGANGVNDLEARKYLYFMKDFSNQYFWNISKFAENKNFISEYNKIIDEGDLTYDLEREQDRNTELNLSIKKFIRSSEAKVALNFLGIKASKCYCLELPFYGTTHIKRKSPGEEDYQIVRSLFRLIEPTVIFAAGDLADPHGTHRKCLELLIHLYQEDQVKLKADSNYKPLVPPAQNFLLYRGAWEEWSISMARFIVPMSPKEVNQKTFAIWKHQSQKDGPMFLGEDKREFWQRAKSRNRQTADNLNKLGFSDYEACECFVNLNDLKNYDEI